MSGLQPGQANVFFEVHFDKLAPTAVRSAIATDCTSEIDLLVPSATRDTWINRPYTGDGSAADMLDYVDKLFEVVNPDLVPKPQPKTDLYCWLGSQRYCYATFSLENNGSPITMTIEADGYQVECDIRVVMATVPA